MYTYIHVPFVQAVLSGYAQNCSLICSGAPGALQAPDLPKNLILNSVDLYVALGTMVSAWGPCLGHAHGLSPPQGIRQLLRMRMLLSGRASRGALIS
jgi:hypothetical protein